MIAKGKENLHVITSIMFITTYITIFRNLKDVFLSYLFGQFHIVFKIWSLISQQIKKKKSSSLKDIIFLYSLTEDNLGFLPRRNVLLLLGSKRLFIVGHF